MWPSQYPAETIMDFFTYASARCLQPEPRCWCWYQLRRHIPGDGFAVSANYVAANGDEFTTGSDVDGGIANGESNGTGTSRSPTRLMTGTDRAYAYNQGGACGGYIPLALRWPRSMRWSLQLQCQSFALSGWFALTTGVAGCLRQRRLGRERLHRQRRCFHLGRQGW